MKIAVFYNLPFSGAKRTVFEHTKGLKSLGHTVDIYTIDPQDDIFDPARVADIQYTYKYKPYTIPLPFIKRLTQDLSDFFQLKRLHKKIAHNIDARNYDIVLVHTDKFTQAPFLLQFLKTKNVYFCLEPLKIAYEYGLRVPDELSLLNRVYESANRSFRKKIDRENARSADYSLAISYFGRELMIQAFDLYPNISYLGVDTSLFKNIHSPKKNQILFVGQKININGYDVAMKAVKLIPEKVRPELKVLSISSNKTGRLSDQEIVKLYNESLLTLCLSNLDTFGLVTLESLACGVPVIAYNVAGYRETMQDGKTGFLVDFDVQQIADKIKTLISEPTLREKMGEYGENLIQQNWTWSQHIKHLEEILLRWSEQK